MKLSADAFMSLYTLHLVGADVASILVEGQQLAVVWGEQYMCPYDGSESLAAQSI